MLYAETPYSEYVNSFFTDTNLTTPYIPADQGLNNINVSYQLDYETPPGGPVNGRWKDPSNSAVLENKVVLGLDDLGEKIKDQSELHAKITTFTTTGQNTDDGSLSRTRFHNNI